MVHNVHERVLPVPVADVEPLLDGLGGPDDRLWPSPAWAPMVLDGPLRIGASGGHGPIRYRVTAYEPGRMVEFTFHPRVGLHGRHTLIAEPAGPSRTVLRHVVEGRTAGRVLLLWPLAIRWLHDAVLEDLLDRAEAELGTGPARPAWWSPWVRLLQPLEVPRAREVDLPATALLAGALERVDWADAYAVVCHPGMPTDPQAWADAIFRDPPRWVVALLGLRQAVVGLVGIERDDGTAFDTLARTDDEVLLGTDAGHLDFRASVRREPDRVVLSTVVQVHNARGRAYSALVRRVHPVVVRAMLTRAARRLSRAPRVAPTRASGTFAR
ncbi:DUF2867 domain-containing protein [Pseudonocardia nigra]|uniref:DUF2867 domain-containing protein n=1 Tax=Pseudonocardia nigra TaxID=1921578 RepID=UPI001C5D5482|nr:DUF2867 domain-containing protein [Pseudonocardia nigra]